jgi:DNA-directed RNA polymerase subunit beta'
MIIPKEKRRWLPVPEKVVKEFEQQYQDGLITKGEKYNKVVDIWSRMHRRRRRSHDEGVFPTQGRGLNSVYMMAHSGARGSAMRQIRQLAGMRGLMAKPSGEIIETPIISNFKEGLSFLSTSTPPTVRVKAWPIPPSRPRTPVTSPAVSSTWRRMPSC